MEFILSEKVNGSDFERFNVCQ